MDNGIAAIIAAGIASLMSLIVFIGSNIFARINAVKPYKIKIYEKQLFEVFTPLEILLENGDSNVTPELLGKVEEIIYANFTLIPNSLFQEYKKLTEPIQNKEHTTFALRDIVSTYYNSRKKELGYPFKHKAINIWCLDNGESLTAFIKSLKNPTFITLVSFAVATVLAVLFVIVGEEWALIIKAMLLVCLLVVFYLWLIDAPTLKRQGSQYRKAYEKSTKKTRKKQNITPPYQPVIIKSPAKQNNNNINQK